MSAEATEPGGFLLFSYVSINTLLTLSIWMLILLPRHLADNNWSSQTIGWAMGSFFLMHLLAQVFASTLAQRIGSVPTALAGIGLATLGGFFYLASLSFLELVFVARPLHGLGSGLVSAGVLIHLVESVPSHLRGRMMGYFGMPGFVTLGLGPFLAQLLQTRWDLQATYWVIVLNCLVSAGILLRLPRPLVSRKRLRSFSRAMRVNLPRLKWILIPSLFFALCNSSWQSFLAPAVAHIGTMAVSVFGLGYGIGASVFRLVISRFLEQEGRRLVSISALVLFGLALSMLPHLANPVLFALAGVVCGATHGVYYPALSSIATERFHPLVPGHGMSLYSASFSLGYFVGPPAWGAVADQVGYGWMFAGAGSTLAIAILAFVVSELRAGKSSAPER